MSDFQKASSKLTPELYEQFRQAIALGKWPDGRVVSEKQKKIMLESVIIYEANNVSEEKRTAILEDQCASLSSDNSADNQAKTRGESGQDDSEQPITIH